MVDAAGALLGAPQVRLDGDMQFGRRAARAHLVDMHFASVPPASGRCGPCVMFMTSVSRGRSGTSPAR